MIVMEEPLHLKAKHLQPEVTKPIKHDGMTNRLKIGHVIKELGQDIKVEKSRMETKDVRFYRFYEMERFFEKIWTLFGVTDIRIVHDHRCFVDMGIGYNCSMGPSQSRSKQNSLFDA